MKLPHVSHLVVDEENKIEFNVMAYRKLTEAEVLQALRTWRRIYRKKLRPKHRYQVLTVIGANE
jgi:hypothetical protein